MTVWKYLERGTVKHEFDSIDSRDSVCGISPPPMVRDEWLTDSKGLAERRECKQCPIRRAQIEKKAKENTDVQSEDVYPNSMRRNPVRSHYSSSRSVDW